MWCKQCQQDVPAAAPTADGQYACPRCAGVLLSPRTVERGDAADTFDAGAMGVARADRALPHAAVRPWHVARYPREEQLRHTARVLARYGVLLASPEAVEPALDDVRSLRAGLLAGRSTAVAAPTFAAPRVEIVEHPSRRDPRVSTEGRPADSERSPAPLERAAAAVGQPEVEAGPRSPGPSRQSGRSRSWSSALAWGAVSLSVAALSCGGVLACWAIYGGRPELWNLGLPVLIGGQIALALAAMLASDGPSAAAG